ncbi:MAG TPA: flagellar type III secretion system pore protein FliP [Burkholderiales bacterium]|nr:flagellar type III secretion system pore protein FliP [Burkholderiales bacterium]
MMIVRSAARRARPPQRADVWIRRLLLLGCLCCLIALVLLSREASAQASDLPLFNSKPAAGGGQNYSLPVQTLLVLTALAFLPAVLLLMTAFTRIVIVLSLLRHALGTQASPPNQVIIGLSLFLTLFVMGPVADRIYDDAYLPYSQQKIGFDQALDRAQGPLKTFMLKQTREPDLALFFKLARQTPPATKADIPLRVLVPAFVTSELKTAFQIGFMVFLPFLIIDMVVASVLMSMGMMMLSPVLISLPFKLMLFVLVDGWNLLIGSLVASFG